MSYGEHGEGDFLIELRARVNERCAEFDGLSDLSGPAFREDGFTQIVLETLEDLGHLVDVQNCFLEKKHRQGIVKVNGWCVDESEGRLDLVTTIYKDAFDFRSVTKTEIQQAIRRAVRILPFAESGAHDEMEPSDDAHDMVHRISELAASIERIRVVVFVDGIAADHGYIDTGLQLPELQIDVWDLRRLYRAQTSGLPYEPISIDLVARIGKPLPCLPMPRDGADYEAYLAIMPGELLHDLYHEFGPRLLELNVRSFLQLRGNVNKGIRATLMNEPSRFLAYNNGISATAESVDVIGESEGTPAIRSIIGLQIVNGGQTVASIHRVGQVDKIDLSSVFVQTKITIVSRDKLESLVPRISRYANTQNRVNEADFSANHPFHVGIQQLSETIWVPGEQSRWFYERARGQYQVAKAGAATTVKGRRVFEAATPTHQKFDKVLLAKFVNVWDQLPHLGGRGGQKNFVAFMERLKRDRGAQWEPDAQYYKHLVAKAIIYKEAERIARSEKLPAYRANAIAYTVALVSYRTAGRVDLDRIWMEQRVSEALQAVLEHWITDIHIALIETAGQRNVTEWCKKDDCWRRIQMLDLKLPLAFESELADGQPLPTVGSEAGRKGRSLTHEDRENISRVLGVDHDGWIRLIKWGTNSGALQEWQVGIASTLAGYAALNWSQVPSAKQARHAVRMLKEAGGEVSLRQVEDET